MAKEPKNRLEKATFAGGCFWCMELPFEKLHGVSEVVSGYIGGEEKNPTYDDYAKKGYVEAVQIIYNPAIISYNQLLDTFWRQIDPTDDNGQFADRGSGYKTAIFYHTLDQKKMAESSKKELENAKIFTSPIVTKILPATQFYIAEQKHQDYYLNYPLKYKWYRARSGRDEFLKKTWGNSNKAQVKSSSKYFRPSEEEIKKKLTQLQYNVTQKDKTERAFENAYWDNKDPGIYVDIVSGEPLFSSQDMFRSGTGWPSFIRPLEPDNIVQKEDRGWFTTRTEVRSKHANSHLGHVFDDGPPPTGLRYCINSAALKFIPVKDLEKEGYSQYLSSFENTEER